MIKRILMIKLLVTLTVASVVPSIAVAKDITNEQRQAYQARERYNDNKSDYENLLRRIAKQEKHLIEEQEKLNQLKKDEVAAKLELEQSKADLDAKTQRLNEVWDSRREQSE